MHRASLADTGYVWMADARFSSGVWSEYHGTFSIRAVEFKLDNAVLLCCTSSTIDIHGTIGWKSTTKSALQHPCQALRALGGVEVADVWLG